MDLLISDTCILIDLHKGELLEKINELPYNLGVPDAILSELVEPGEEEILKSGFDVYSLESEEIIEAFRLNGVYSHPSIVDIFGLVLAKKHEATLLTGDKKLRIAAKREGVAFKGTLWILDEMIEKEVIDMKTASESLRKIIDEGSYLPKIECDKRFEQWKS